MLDDEAALLAQHLGDNDGTTEDIEQVFLLEFVGLHQLAQDLDRPGRRECVGLVFEVFDENGQQFCPDDVRRR